MHAFFEPVALCTQNGIVHAFACRGRVHQRVLWQSYPRPGCSMRQELCIEGQQWKKVKHMWLACWQEPQLHLPGLASTYSSLLQQLAAPCPARAPAPAVQPSCEHHGQDNKNLGCSHSHNSYNKQASVSFSMSESPDSCTI